MKLIDVNEGEDGFLDYGSGSGRMLILADHMYRFKKIIGVELAEEMVSLSKENIVNVRNKGNLRCDDIEIAHADATKYVIPGEINIIYFYNPFSGSVLRQTLENIRKSLDMNPRKMTVIVKSPEHFEEETEDFPWLKQRTSIGKGIRYAFNIYDAE